MLQETDPQSLTRRLSRERVQAAFGVNQDFGIEHDAFGAGYRMYLGELAMQVQLDVFPKVPLVCLEDADMTLMFGGITDMHEIADGIRLERTEDNARSLSIDITRTGLVAFNRVPDNPAAVPYGAVTKE